MAELCAEIREFFIDAILKNGGHFSANLGVVELTVALHYVFDMSSEKLVWDVGHQAYIHKLLTGRKDEFSSIRKWGGLSGFPKRSESKFDHFGTGHSSTSISAVLGMAEAARLQGLDRHHLAVIGDGSLSGGMAFEALNNMGMSAANVLVLINDNEMGIDPNLGAINQHLERIEHSKENFFENLGIPYFGPIDGHDVLALVNTFEDQKALNFPRVVHLKTIKGKGYPPAEEEQTKWHSVKYVKVDVRKSDNKEEKPPKYQEVFGQTLLQLARENENVIGVTPAMPSGSSMNMMMEEFPQRVFDVGIAEQHAVTFAAGLALEGKKVFCHLYSSFAQRAYDQIIHDVALQNIPLILCLDRAGLAGEDGPTHHGLFDIAALKAIPNLEIIAPMDAFELQAAMRWALTADGPTVIRYPKGRVDAMNWKLPSHYEFESKSRFMSKGSRISIVSIGTLGNAVQKAMEKSKNKSEITHLDLRFAKSLDVEALREVFESSERILCLEDGILEGGIGQEVQSIAQRNQYNGSIEIRGVCDEFSPHGTIEKLHQHYGLDSESIARWIDDASF